MLSAKTCFLSAHERKKCPLESRFGGVNLPKGQVGPNTGKVLQSKVPPNLSL